MKRYHSAIRTKALDSAPAALREQAYGSGGGKGCDMASLCSRAFVAALHKLGASGALFFWDLREAFHRIIRQLLWGRACTTDEEMAFLLNRLDLGPEIMNELRGFFARR